MKLLLDSCVWGPASSALRDAGHDVIWAGDWQKDPGDREILRRAHQDDRVLVTLDKDFGELAIIQNRPHSGIVRLVGFSAREQAAACLEVLALYADEVRQGALITADPARVRIRPGEPSG
jgi:predicted nuclease of predicted toxin-antitoxin system